VTPIERKVTLTVEEMRDIEEALSLLADRTRTNPAKNTRVNRMRRMIGAIADHASREPFAQIGVDEDTTK
jgi:predicted LPLAT superfamily acyltransferase